MDVSVDNSHDRWRHSVPPGCRNLVRSLHQQSAIRRDPLTGHERALVGDEPEDGVGDVLRLPCAPDGCPGDDAIPPLRTDGTRHRRVDVPRAHGIDPDAVRADLLCDRTREAEYPRL